MKQFRRVRYFLLAPATALSLLSIVEIFSSRLGGAFEFLDVVHSLIVRWNYWHGFALAWVDAFVSLRFHADAADRNLILVIFSVVLPSLFLTLRHRAPVWRDPAIFVLQGMVFLLSLGYFLLALYLLLVPHEPNNWHGISAILFVGVVGFGIFSPGTRSFAGPIAWALVFLLSLEAFRFVPSMDALQEWLEDVPMDYRDAQ